MDFNDLLGSYLQQQNPSLGRYQPPTMDNQGGWNNQGGYYYNLPGEFGGVDSGAYTFMPQFQQNQLGSALGGASRDNAMAARAAAGGGGGPSLSPSYGAQRAAGAFQGSFNPVPPTGISNQLAGAMGPHRALNPVPPTGSPMPPQYQQGIAPQPAPMPAFYPGPATGSQVPPQQQPHMSLADILNQMHGYGGPRF